MTKENGIPFLDLVAPHQELRSELTAAFNAALDCGGFIGGPVLEAFEQEFAAFCDAPYCVGVGSGTDALRFALIAAGVGAGDIAVTVPNTFIATAEAIRQAGAQPVFVDVDERSYNMDPEKLREYLESGCVRRRNGALVDRKSKLRVAAIVPVHLYGQPADMDPLLELGSRFGLKVIEDACQAHGAEYFSGKEGQWRKAGSMGVAAAFSFYPGKNLGACGEAGAVTTGDPELARKVRMLRDHGQSKKYYHDIEGWNGRLDAIQAGMLQVKLRRLAQWNRQRRECAALYGKLLAAMAPDTGVPAEPSWSRPVYHLYVVRHPERDALQAHLSAQSIGTGIHYPIPLHLQTAYESLGYSRGDFPVSEQAASEILSLPMYPQLKVNQQQRVVEAIAEVRRASVMTATASPGRG
jgi:dTDP-4-amino-4,6-dideoxygalactose transaminase